MIILDIPGFGVVHVEDLVSDFTGNLSFNGKLIPGVKEKLNELADQLTIHVLTSDTFGTAKEELRDVTCEVHVL